MAHAEPAKQLSFRLPGALVDRIHHCMAELRASGLEVNRADMVRLLLQHALDATQCKVELLLGGRRARGDASKRI
ncbi:MAG: hypothetical protein EOO74_04445 [Myxococcales bacterium]|nr:MAG: hypothetical protein EOO74_04445 [Myxococcales bacterium]